ncbi:MAG: Ribosomal large subunit pseudouridine synthase B [Gemmatimonadaceae bacterium]|nr:Ribosomal large subunit pseudouridine synthase B [Gemmatimonadaceae bacterium]
MRIHRALARAGIASRRKAEDLVRAGRVAVNGVVATVGQVVDPETDTIRVDGRPVIPARHGATWIVLHKPAGVMTTRHDPEGRRTVFDLVSDSPGLTYVGRLDFLTEGVMLLTTDGDAAHALTHPSTEVERVYEATVRGDARRAAREAVKGVPLGDGMATPSWARARTDAAGHSILELGLAEGRKREVRRICRALGLDVERLVRTRFGPVELGSLPSGRTRPLTSAERDAIDVLVSVQARRKHAAHPG